MDAPEEDVDIKLQKISGDLIADFDRSLQPFLRKRDVAGGTPVRSRVRTRETDRLVSTVRNKCSQCLRGLLVAVAIV
jgi:hypothetical protein